MPHSGVCLCGKTKVEVEGDSFKEQVQTTVLWRRTVILTFNVTRLFATARIVGRLVEVLSALTFSHLKKVWRSLVTPSRSTPSKRLVETLVNLLRIIILDGKVLIYRIIVTRIFCGNCGSAISHKSVVFGEAQAIQTGNFADFAKIPIKTEREFFINSLVSTFLWLVCACGQFSWRIVGPEWRLLMVLHKSRPCPDKYVA